MFLLKFIFLPINLIFIIKFMSRYLRMFPKEDTRKPFLNEFLKMRVPTIAFALSAPLHPPFVG